MKLILALHMSVPKSDAIAAVARGSCSPDFLSGSGQGFGPLDEVVEVLGHFSQLFCTVTKKCNPLEDAAYDGNAEGMSQES